MTGRSIIIGAIFLSWSLLIPGCGEGEAASTRERVELTMWLVGDSVPDYDLMLQELNKIMLEDINATLKVNFTTWTDWTTNAARACA